MVASGTLVVLEVDPAYVVPRNTLEPVLFAGNVAIHRLNQGDKSGRVIGIVPGDVDRQPRSPSGSATPQLPERLTPALVDSERALAAKAGVRAFGQAKIAAVTRPRLAAADLASLLRTTGAELVLQVLAPGKSVGRFLAIANGESHQKAELASRANDPWRHIFQASASSSPQCSCCCPSLRPLR